MVLQHNRRHTKADVEYTYSTLEGESGIHSQFNLGCGKRTRSVRGIHTDPTSELDLIITSEDRPTNPITARIARSHENCVYRASLG
jgi:hypothetical protein